MVTWRPQCGSELFHKSCDKTVQTCLEFLLFECNKMVKGTLAELIINMRNEQFNIRLPSFIEFSFFFIDLIASSSFDCCRPATNNKFDVKIRQILCRKFHNCPAQCGQTWHAVNQALSLDLIVQSSFHRPWDKNMQLLTICLTKRNKIERKGGKKSIKLNNNKSQELSKANSTCPAGTSRRYVN